MSDNQSAFGAVGDNVLGYVGSGAAHVDTRYTKSTPRGTMGRGASPTGTAGSRSNKLSEKCGPKFTPIATLYRQNAAEASATQRNTYTVPSKAGVGDFWAARSRSGQVI